MHRREVIERVFSRRIWTGTVALSIPVGIVAGLGALLFAYCLDGLTHLLLERGAGFVMPQPGSERHALPHGPDRWWLLALLPAAGGLLAGWLIYTFAPEAEGHGTDAVIWSFHQDRGRTRARVPIIKTIASVLTIGSGGAAGREGPIGQIGAGFASIVTTALKTGDRERRLLMLAGAGAGIGAIFRAPLGAALFIAEVLYRDMEFESAALVPAFIASIIAYSVYCTVTGVWGPIFTVRPIQFNRPAELPICLGLGLVCAIVGWIYVRVFYGMRDRVFRRIKIPNHFKPAIGGLAVGLIALAAPQALGMGYGYVQEALNGSLPLRMAAILVVVKMVANALTISSGGSGGMFAPSMIIGGCLGMTVGTLMHRYAPGGQTINSTEWVLIGMAGFFAGVAKAPIASLVMVSEMTQGYGLLVPLMLTCAVSYLLTPRWVGIYENQVMTRADSPAHEGEFMYDVLSRVYVKEVLDPKAGITTFRRDTPLSQILKRVVEIPQEIYPIVDGENRLDGVIDMRDIRLFFTEHGIIEELLVASDLMAADCRMIEVDEDLGSALLTIQATQAKELPVVNSAEERKLVGILSRRDILQAYRERMYHEKE